MSAVTNRLISYDESAGVCFFHNTTVGGTLANKKARRDHMTDLDIRLRPHVFLVFKPSRSTEFHLNILFSYFTNMANN